MKCSFAQFLPNAYRAAQWAHRSQKSENWELADLRDRVSWSVAQYMMSFEKQIAKKTLNRKSKLVLRMQFSFWLSLATDLTTNSVCDQFRFMTEIISKLLHTAIWSRSAVWLDFRHMLFSRTGFRFRSAALPAQVAEDAVLFLWPICTRTYWLYRNIEQSDERCLGL